MIKAAVLFQIGSPLVLMDLEFPQLGKGQVLIKLAYTGICRSQINEIKGLKGADPYLPHTLGHEGSGIVMECGEGVTKVKPGDHVIATWIKGNGLDAAQIVYKAADGTKINSGPISTFMDHAVIGENRLIPISAEIPLREAALFGCAIPTGAGIVYNDLQVKPNSSLAIFGVGGIGASALLAAYSRKPSQLIAIDVEESKLILARLLGATHTIHAKSENVLDAIAKLTEGKGVDFAIEAVGQKNVMEIAFKSVKDKGGVCALAGNVSKGTNIECDPFDFIKGKKLIGSWGGGVQPDRDIPLFLERFMQTDQKLETFISHVSPLSRINEAISMMEEQKAARMLVDCSL